MPRCLPDGEVDVCSGHTLKPLMRALVSSGSVGFSVGRILVLSWVNKSLVYSSIGKSLMLAVPFKIFIAYSLVHSSLISSCKGVTVNGVPVACE